MLNYEVDSDGDPTEMGMYQLSKYIRDNLIEEPQLMYHLSFTMGYLLHSKIDLESVHNANN